MCGILGLWGLKPDIGAFSSQLNLLSHRGPDDTGIWTDEKEGLILGHKRLSIIDLSQAGHQPIVDEKQNYAMVYNGEIYNHRQLRENLERRGCRFRGTCDTEVLFKYLICYGIAKTLADVDGMYAFAFWDGVNKTLYLARDHIGIKPLYYGYTGDGFIFASELRAIEANPAFAREINPKGLSYFFTYKFIPAPLTIYKNINKLEAGCYLEIRKGCKPVNKRYYDYVDVAINSRRTSEIKDENEAIEAIEDSLGRSIDCRLIADVPVGIFLSGGIDSAIIACVLARKVGRLLQSFMIGFEDKNYDESVFAVQVAKHLGLEHNEKLFSAQEVAEIVPQIGGVYDEPFADTSQLPTYLVSKFARCKVKVVLSGDGGDEMFAGYNRYVAARQLAGPVKKYLLKFLIGSNNSSRALNLLEFYGDIRRKKLKLIISREHLTRLSYLSKSSDISQIYASLMMNFDKQYKYFENVEYFDKLDDRIDDYPADEGCMLYDALYFLPEDVFTKLDRATMAVGLEGRVPMVSREMVKTAWNISHALKIKRRRRKYILYRLLRRYLPQNLIDRPKSGFGAPVGEWFRTILKDWLSDLINSRLCSEDPFIHGPTIKKMLENHLLVKGDWTQSLWSAAMYLEWKRQRV